MRRLVNIASLILLIIGWITTDLAAQASNSPLTRRSSGLTIEVLDRMTHLPGGLAALPAPPIPDSNPQSAAKINLGRALFSDKRLSTDGSFSCATCHDPAKAYSDGRAIAVGMHHAILKRRAPSLLNAAYNTSQLWDGRSKSLEDQVSIPLLARDEFGMPDRKTLLARLKSNPQYVRQFRAVFGREVNLLSLEQAISAFERTLVTPDSAFDRYMSGDKSALTDQEKRGLILFIGKAACSQCHNGPNFTDNKFHDLGLLPGEGSQSDLGRFEVTRRPADRRAFKTPSLRSSSQQSFFMHNGSSSTVEQVVDFYNNGGGKGPKSKLLFQLDLTPAEKRDLIVFLQSLAGHLPANVDSN